MNEKIEDMLNTSETEETIQQMNHISVGLDEALNFGLEVEVIYWALRAMKENPTLSPAEAFYLGVNEWVK